MFQLVDELATENVIENIKPEMESRECHFKEFTLFTQMVSDIVIIIRLPPFVIAVKNTYAENTLRRKITFVRNDKS